jgi:hypothetical protein
MTTDLLEKLKEAAQSVLPVSAIVLALHFTVSPLPFWSLMLFLTGTLLLIIGMSIFTMGADIAMMPIGEAIGAELTKSKNIWLIVGSAFILGVVVTIAEPDLQVLTKQVPAVPDMVLVSSVAFGVGVFLVLALLRILFQFSLSYMFIVSYVILFIVAALTAPDFLAVGFDSGGVTTGPITVPFILALGAGISAVRGGKSSEEDSFGLCSLCSIGPVLAVLVMGMFFDASGSGFAFEPNASVNNLGELLDSYYLGFILLFQEVLTILLPIVVIFILFQFIRLKLSKTKLIRILIGIVYTLIGLSIFLTGVNIGFMPAGTYIGKELATLPYNWILIPLSAIIGFFVVYAEPAVHVLNKQVEDITSGSISKKMMMTGLSLGTSAALILSVVRILTEISIWYFLLPGYLLALGLTFFTPKIFTAIAFDSGGVAAGTMTAAFLLPFAVGICEAVGGNVMTDAFGIIAMVAMMPLITIQVVGVIYNMKLMHNKNLEETLHTDLLFATSFDEFDEPAGSDSATAPLPYAEGDENSHSPNSKNDLDLHTTHDNIIELTEDQKDANLTECEQENNLKARKEK